MIINIKKISEKISYMREKSLSRYVLHTEESTINLMIVKVSKNTGTNRAHKNKDRDELFSVIEGEVLYSEYSGESGELLLSNKLQSDPFLFRHIPANSYHDITAITSEAYILEILGGKFIAGSTIYFDKKY